MLEWYIGFELFDAKFASTEFGSFLIFWSHKYTYPYGGLVEKGKIQTQYQVVMPTGIKINTSDFEMIPVEQLQLMCSEILRSAFPISGPATYLPCQVETPTPCTTQVSALLISTSLIRVDREKIRHQPISVLLYSNPNH